MKGKLVAKVVKIRDICKLETKRIARAYLAAAMGTHLRGRCIVETRCTTFLQYAAQIIRNRKIRIWMAHRAKNCTFAAEKLLKYGCLYLLFSGLHGG